MNGHLTILDQIDNVFKDGRAAAWFPGKQLFIADAKTCRDILRNEDNLYEETSDFFSTKWGILSPRSTQIKITASAKEILHASLRKKIFLNNWMN